jgi:ABC-type uncharacterized transport system substrate-binding protein
MKPTLLAALLFLLPSLLAAAESPRRLAVVFDAGDPSERDLFLDLAQEYRSREAVFPYELRDDERTDPIAKGKLLSKLATCDLVVAIGNAATDFAVTEVEEVPVYFVDATVVPGRSLQSPSVAGLFGFSVEDLLDAAKTLRLDAVGLAYTPGYEPVAEWIRAGAAARGLAFVSRRIALPKELPSDVRDLGEKSKAIWLVGDPLLVRGAGFDFIQDFSLSERFPIIGPGRWAVLRGALLGSAPDHAAQKAVAVRAIDSILKDRRLPAPRLQAAARGGMILINAPLASKWDVKAPEGPRWRWLR